MLWKIIAYFYEYLLFRSNSKKSGIKSQLRQIWNFFTMNKNTLTGPVNCKKTTRHHSHLPLCAKSRKTNDAKSRKWAKTSTWANFWRFRCQISPNCNFFLKNRFHSNWSSYLVLTSGQKPKKLLEPFLRQISKCLILG